MSIMRIRPRVIATGTIIAIFLFILAMGLLSGCSSYKYTDINALPYPLVVTEKAQWGIVVKDSTGKRYEYGIITHSYAVIFMDNYKVGDTIK